MELILIRHGATAWNKDRRFQSNADNDLSELGREQARRLGERLKNRKISRIIASPMRRAQDTAAAIAVHHGLAVETEERLREIDYGYWEGKNAPELVAEGDPLIPYYLKDRDFYGFPGEGSFFNARNRIGAYVDELKRQYWDTDDVIVLVGHAAIFRMAIFHLLDLGNIYYKRFDPANTGMTVFRITKENGIQLVCFNDMGHLEGM